MRFQSNILVWRYLLFPFAILYGAVIYLRNFLFDKGFLKTKTYDFPIICIGNLSVGGTGKTPMTELIVSALLDRNYKVATLSRGYKRKTKGFLMADTNTTALEIGDEPMQFHQHFPEALVTVGEDRSAAIDLILNLKERKPDLIILDDAMQHRRVKASYNILLTDYHCLYSDDYFLPVGSLRDQVGSSKRANVVVVTKCPMSLSFDEKDKLEKQLGLSSSQILYCSAIDYGTPYSFFSRENLVWNKDLNVIAIAGIAKPEPFFSYLKTKGNLLKEIALPDHQDITNREIDKIFSNIDISVSEKSVIFIMTEKDAPKFLLFKERLKELSVAVYVLPIKSVILFQEKENFLANITAVINNR